MMQPRSSLAAALATAALAATALAAQSPTPSNPEELGAVAWERDFDAACATAKRSGKPILLLFQEVPG